MCAKIANSRKPLAPSSATTSADAHVELKELADVLRRATLEVAWRQWRALGAGAATRAKDTARQPGAPSADTSSGVNALIDPEALVLISLVLVDEERRLADLLNDWVAWNSDLLSIQRVKNLAKDYPPSVRPMLVRKLAWFAAVGRDSGKDLRWRSAADAWTEEARREQSAPELGEGPGEYLRAGHVEARATERGRRRSAKFRATRSRLTAPATLLLRLRLGFGVGVKADLLAFLLARAEEWATVRDIAEATAYTPAAVRRAAEDLAAARLVEAIQSQPASYRVSYAAWAPLLELEGDPPRWGSWHVRFVFTAAFLQWAESVRERPLSPYALGVHGRDLLERYRPAFERDLVAVWSSHSPIQDWAAFLRQAVHSLADWMREMA